MIPRQWEPHIVYYHAHHLNPLKNLTKGPPQKAVRIIIRLWKCVHVIQFFGFLSLDRDGSG